MESPGTGPAYDPERALALAGGSSATRDRTLTGVLEFLQDPARGGRLLDVRRYQDEAASCYELAHRAVGLVRQAAMPDLETLLRALTDALDAQDLEQAHGLGLQLPVAIDAVRSAVSASRPSA
jgi:hypothetical protein